MTELKKYLYWIGGILTAITLFVAGVFALLIVFDEAAYWRTLLRQGNYQELDTVFSELENTTADPFRLVAWVFQREIQQRFSHFNDVKNGLVISAVEKRVAHGETCSVTGGDYSSLKNTLQVLSSSGIIKTKSREGLCEIEYRVTNKAFGVNIQLSAAALPSDKKGYLNIVSGEYGFLKPGESRSLSVRLGQIGVKAHSYRILAIAGQRQRIGSTDWIWRAKTESDIKDLTRRMERLGLVLVSARHEIHE